MLAVNGDILQHWVPVDFRLGEPPSRSAFSGAGCGVQGADARCVDNVAHEKGMRKSGLARRAGTAITEAEIVYTPNHSEMPTLPWRE